MNYLKWKEVAVDLLVDIIASMAIAVGVYNFALNANFPVAGFSGIAIIIYHLTGIPVGVGTLILNIPVAIFCYKFLGSRFLAALCMGVLCGFGYAVIFMRGSSTGGQDFISMAVKKVKPHISLGIITAVQDFSTILLGSILVFKDVDGFIYGIIVTYIMTLIMDKILYGMDEGKMTLIVTERGEELAVQIDEYTGRGSTILRGMGSYSKRKKDVIMCACNNKQMYTIKKMVHALDPEAFTIIVESNEVVGEGFKVEI